VAGILVTVQRSDLSPWSSTELRAVQCFRVSVRGPSSSAIVQYSGWQGRKRMELSAGRIQTLTGAE
jgi:hypothetical protein